MEFLISTAVLWFVWPAIIGFLAYKYLTRGHDYWRKKGVPFVQPLPIFGSLIGSFNKPLHEEDISRYKKYGRVHGYYEGAHPCLTVAEPHLLRDILVKDFQFFPNRRKFAVDHPMASKMLVALEGEGWKRVRGIVSPTFTTGKIRRMLDVFKDCAHTLSNNLRVAATEGKPVNAKASFGAFAMDVVASSAFSTKLDSHNDTNNQFMAMAKSAFDVNFPWRVILFFMFPGFMKFFKISVFNPAAMNFFKDVTLQIIAERKRTGQTRNDFLQLLMDVTKEVSEEEQKEQAKEDKEEMTRNYGMEENNEIFKQHLKNKSLSNDELVAQCVIFFLAGRETTGSTLSFASYQLALNPQIQETLIQEIDKQVKEAGGTITYEVIQNMKYLDNIISETLRMYPPGTRLERRAEADYKLGDTGITVPKEMIVSVPIYAMHYDPEIFPEPEKFNPDRFTAEEKSRRNPYMYLPFGSGPRNCIGMRFALMEVKVCLAYVFSHFRVRRCSDTQVPLQFRIGRGVLQPIEIKLEFEVRDDSVLKN